MTLGLRPDDLMVTTGDSVLEGTVSVIEPLGSETLVYVSLDGTTEESAENSDIIAKAPGKLPPIAGDQVRLGIDVENMHLFDTESGLVLD